MPNCRMLTQAKSQLSMTLSYQKE